MMWWVIKIDEWNKYIIITVLWVISINLKGLLSRPHNYPRRAAARGALLIASIIWRTPIKSIRSSWKKIYILGVFFKRKKIVKSRPSTTIYKGIAIIHCLYFRISNCCHLETIITIIKIAINKLNNMKKLILNLDNARGIVILRFGGWREEINIYRKRSRGLDNNTKISETWSIRYKVHRNGKID